MFGGLIMAGIMIAYFFSQRGKGGGSNFIMFGGIAMMMASFSASAINYVSQKKKYRRTHVKRDEVYRRVLQEYQQKLEELAGQQREALWLNYPPVSECIMRVRDLDPHLWERSLTDADFLSLRVGSGEMPLITELKAPTQGIVIEPDHLIIEAQALANGYRTVREVPICFNLGENAAIGLAGTRGSVLNLTRDMVIQLATHHSPEEVKIIAIYPPEESHLWEWMRWLPHVWSENRTQRYLACEKMPAHQLLSAVYDVLNRRQLQAPDGSADDSSFLPHFVILLSDPELVENEPVVHMLLSATRSLGATPVFMGDDLESLPKGCKVVAGLERGAERLIYSARQTEPLPFRSEPIDVSTAERFARMMAPIKLKGFSTAFEIPKTLSFLEMWNASEVGELQAKRRWEASRPFETLAAPIGFKAGGKPLIFDMHEKAHGPHGLLAGATGSGKSEILQTIIASLALNYHPHELTFVLVDYKGGGMANAFLNLPHLAGVITNLEGNLSTRALIALKAELKRRQQILADHGVNHIDAYIRKYRAGEVREPLPHLAIIIDEFAELKSEQPGFMQELISAVRVGRSLGVHLLLATQKPAGVVDEQIWGNARFRLCLRVERPEDSREVLKRPDAATITLPGRAYLQVGNDEIFELFQSAYGGMPYVGITTVEEEEEVFEMRLDGSRVAHGKVALSAPEDDSYKAVSQIQAVEKYLHSLAEEEGITTLPGPWLPPLPETVSLDDILRKEAGGWNGSGWKEPAAWIQAIAGIVDDPSRQAQSPLRLNIGEEGHLAIYGTPGSGKTTLLQTIIKSLAHLYSPEDLNIYIMDLGGRTLNLFSPLPQVGEVMFEEDEEKIFSLFRLLGRELEKRKELFSQQGVNTLSAYRAATGERLPALVVVIDNISNFTSVYMEKLDNVFIKQVQEGGSAGIHFIITANGPNDIRTKISSNISLAVALELSDNSEYSYVVGRTGDLFPARVSGRGLVKSSPPLEFQTALASFGDTEVDRANGIRAYVEEMDDKWKGMRAPAVPILPEEIELGDLVNLGVATGVAAEEGGRLNTVVGLCSEDLEPLPMYLEEGPHFVISGPPQSGKTTLLQSILLGLCARYDESRLSLYLVDFSRSDLGCFKGLKQTRAFIGTDQALDEAMVEIVQEIETRKGLLAQAGEDQREADGLEPLRSRPLLVLAVSDFFSFADKLAPDKKAELERIIKRERGMGFHLLIVGMTSDLGSCWDGYFKAVLEGKTGFLLGSTDHEDIQLFKLRLPLNETGLSLPPGNGLYVRRGRAMKFKAALPQGGGASLQDCVQGLMKRRV
jgi:S-DNA-T family DNA segregation ATPase FtsK/SpoIIIE